MTFSYIALTSCVYPYLCETLLCFLSALPPRLFLDTRHISGFDSLDEIADLLS